MTLIGQIGSDLLRQMSYTNVKVAEKMDSLQTLLDEYNCGLNLISRSCSIIHSYAAGLTQLSRRLPALSSSRTLSFLLAHLGGWHNTDQATVSKHCKFKITPTYKQIGDLLLQIEQITTKIMLIE
jgi:hypothetical protein